MHKRWFQEQCGKLKLRREMLPDILPQTAGTERNFSDYTTEPSKRRSFFVILSDGTVLNTPSQEKTKDTSCHSNSKTEVVWPHLKETSESTKAVTDK